MACRIASRIDPDAGKAAAGTIQVVKSHRVELMSSPPYFRPFVGVFTNKVSGTGGRIFRAWSGLIWLYFLSQRLMATSACLVVWTHSALSTCYRKVLLRRSFYHVSGKNCPAPFSNPCTFPRRARIDLHGFESNALHPRGGLSFCG